LQTARILLPRTMEARVLAQELLDYEIHVDEKANDTSAPSASAAMMTWSRR
jgi:hypothetical protein